MHLEPFPFLCPAEIALFPVAGRRLWKTNRFSLCDEIRRRAPSVESLRRHERMTVGHVEQRVSARLSNEIMQQEIRPLLAVDIIEQLHRQFALLSGGRGKDGAPIIIFPEYSGFSEVPEEDFLNVVTYLTSIPSLDAASIGFIIIIDRRKDKWSSVKASLSRIAVSSPAACRSASGGGGARVALGGGGAVSSGLGDR
uniref:MCF.2 cell line derived transforming sequence-like 2 n=1 Tax=Salarias fasciatus TaxID=181472 RepID=A0A672GCX3_SALFA